MGYHAHLTLVMPLLEPLVPLAQDAVDGKPLIPTDVTVETVFGWCASLLQALLHLHTLRIVHLDLKPRNLYVQQAANHSTGTIANSMPTTSALLSTTGFLQIGDFGCAHYQGQPLRSATSHKYEDYDVFTVGTNGYRAPELEICVHKKAVHPIADTSMDMFSFGRIIDWLLMEITLPVDAAFPRQHEMHRVLQQLMLECTAEEPSQRPSAAEALQELDTVLQQLPNLVSSF